MKTTRTFASACLTASCIALIVAANVSVGDQPGVFRMTAAPLDDGPGAVQNGIVPVPDSNLPPNGGGDTAGQVNLGADNAPGQVTLNGDTGPGNDPNVFLGPSAGVTSPVLATQAFQQHLLIAPQVTFERIADHAIGTQDSYTRFNTFIPNHLLPDTTILAMSLSASLSDDGDDLYNWGAIYRHYDQTRNRVWGMNIFGDFDSTAQLDDYQRIGFGLESLGRYIDFIFNGYVNTGNDTTLTSSTPLTGLSLSGNNVVRSFSELRENVYEGVDWKIGMPLPWFGRRGVKAFLGSYYLASENGPEEALGVSAQLQAQITESLAFNAFYTNDEVFRDNAWFSIAYSIPHTRRKRFMRPKTVRERLSDPVQRTNTIHTRLEESVLTVSEINPKTGLPWTINYVDPNATVMGTGTIESPYMTLQAAIDANDPTIDAIRIAPRVDETGTNLTVAGGIDLFDEQSLFSSHKDFTLFEEAGSAFVIPAESTSTLGPLVSDPTMMAGGSVIRIADWNRISGLRIDASNAAGTVFGMGVDAPAPFDSVQLVCNTFTNYTVAANLPDGEGELLFDDNTFQGLAGVSQTGLELSTVAGTHDLRIHNNTGTNNATAGVNVTAQAGSTIDADNPLGTGGVTATGITDNNFSSGGQGVVMTAEAGGEINAVVERNTFNDNTFNGFIGRADGGVFNLASFRSNTLTGNLENGAFLHFLNGGVFAAVTEDLNGDGVLDPGEDLNGNGILDQGIVTNTMNNNGLAGLCLFGEDASTGDFDIGGPNPELGNTFSGNTGAGVAVDLQDSSTAGIDALFNTVTGGSTTPGLTIVLDFVDPSQGSVVDALGRTVNPFDVTAYGFQAGDFGLVTNAILQTVRNHYSSIPTSGMNPNSPIPDGFELNLDFVIGDAGVAPSNGATEYYVVTIGDSAMDLGGLAGQAADIGNVRNAMGNGPGQGLGGVAQAIGASAAAVYTNSINSFSPLLTPPNALTDPTSLTLAGSAPAYAVNALTSGDLTSTRRAIGLVTSHELGHTLSLRHILASTAVTPNGGPPIMGTPAFDLPLQSLLEEQEFATTGTNPGEIPGEAPFTQNSVAQLASAIGTRTAGREQANGIVIVANDTARLRESTFINNDISGSSNVGLGIEMNDMAVAEDVTIQGNTLTGNGTGIRLVANGATAVINVDNTIGGTGMNTYAGVSYNQGNTVTASVNDGIRVLAADGGTVLGNMINNQITNNGGNGAALLIEGGGTIDFGTPASNRLITGNTFSGNTGVGLLAISTVDVTVSNLEQEMNLFVQGNLFSMNDGGGFLAELNGVNNIPPGPPALGFDENNVLNLIMGQTTMPFSSPVASESNSFDQNGGVGIGVIVNGTGLANVSIVGNTVTNTTTGSNPDFDGDGIGLIRRDSSLLLADVLFNTSTGNASNGLEVDTQGTNKDNFNQPMVGTVNSVTWNNNLFNNNGANGASFTTRGDSQLFANGASNVTMGNTLSGVRVNTRDNSSIGDPTLVGDARRTVFTGLISTNNGQDGLELISQGGSQLLLEVTSERIPTTSGAHAALNTMGDTSLSSNGRDGIHIVSGGIMQEVEPAGGYNPYGYIPIPVLEDSFVDILVTAETPVTPTSAVTLIDGNGTGAAGGNGIFWDALGAAWGEVQVYHTIITNNIAGVSEDTNGDGILTFAEDTLGNFDQNQRATSPSQDGTGAFFVMSDLEGNLDIDVVNGDGIQFNYYHAAGANAAQPLELTVGAAGMGNRIQSNEDDGIALTGDVVYVGPQLNSQGDPVLDLNGNPIILAIPHFQDVPQPDITISNNLIGGTNDGTPAGNAGDGVSIRSFGFVASGIPPTNVDFSIPPADNNPLSPDFPGSIAGQSAIFRGGGAADIINNAFRTTGPAPNINLLENTITLNGRIGVNIRLQGGNGAALPGVGFLDGTEQLRPKPVAANLDFINRITLDGNTISSNGEEGVFMRADADMNQNRIVFTQNVGMNFDINTTGNFAAQAGFDPGDVDSRFPFLNFDTVQNSLLTVVNNTIQSNGTNSVNGEGLEIRVGTGAYVAADVRDNIFGGNLQADLYTGSFMSDVTIQADGTALATNPFDSLDNSGQGVFDVLYLEDAALLDMRFTGNTGDQINPQENTFFLTTTTEAVDITATYSNLTDPLKGATLRDASVFKIDDFAGLNAPTNNFVELGATQNIQDAFSGDPLAAPGTVDQFRNFTILNGSIEPLWPEEPFTDED